MLTRTRLFVWLGCMFLGLAPTTLLMAQVTGTTTTAPSTTTTAVNTTTSGVTNTATTAVSPTTTTASSTSTAVTTTSPAKPLPVTQAQLAEWDIPSNADMRAGALTIDLYSNGGQKIWFTTRDNLPRVYMFQPAQNTKYGSAQWTSWPLNPAALGPTGGLKRIRSSYDRRYVFVRTVLSVQKIDTVTDQRTTYCDALLPDQSGCDLSSFSMVSDIAVDNHNNVYNTANGVLQRVNASSNSCVTRPCAPVDVMQWILPDDQNGLASSAGICNGPGGGNDPCLSGVAVHPKYQYLVYVAEPQNNTIAEVDTSCGTVRRWDITKVTDAGGAAPAQPRQINFDQDGILWAVTGSGHLVRLDPKRSTIAAFQIPAGAANDTFGVAPDGGMIGYTATSVATDEHKVAMLVPKARGTYVCPQTAAAKPNPTKIQPLCDTAPHTCGSAQTHARTVNARVTSDPGGTFIEAFINQNQPGSTDPHMSMVPLGIAPNFSKAVGTFFYAVGEPEDMTVIRVGFARLPRKGFKAEHEREDKDFDDDGSGHSDEDHDGIPDRYKSNDGKAKMDRQNDQLGPGQSSDYTLTAGPNTMAMIAAIQADNPLALVSVQIIDPNGATLAPALPAAGVAVATVVPTVPGDYIIRIKNEGATPITHETQLVTRDPLSLP